MEDRVRQFVDYYNHKRYYESLINLTPADFFVVVASQYSTNAKK
ncbi:hypothetical protein [Nitrosomonas aestuarii]|nr:hypothetical protein [Nitrosomonas aestuarii]